MNTLVYIGFGLATIYLLGKLFFNWYEDLDGMLIRKYSAEAEVREAVRCSKGAAYVFCVTAGFVALAVVALVGATSGIPMMLEEDNRLFFSVVLILGIGLVYIAWSKLPGFFTAGDKLKITLGNLLFGLIVVSLMGIFIGAISGAGRSKEK